MLDNTKTADWTEKEWDTFATWLKGMLHSDKVEVTFIKADGSERVMNCTLQPELLPKVEKKELSEDAKPRKESTTSMRVFDLDLQEWRSFTIKKVKKIQVTIG
jgi:hypothetical protein